jgi:hypothetical protein
MKTHLVSNNRRSSLAFVAALILVPGCLLFAQATPPLAQPGNYTGRAITGELVRQPAVNMAELASAPAERQSAHAKFIGRSHEAVIRVYDDGILRIVLPEMITGTDSRTSAGSACTIPCPADSHCSTQLG